MKSPFSIGRPKVWVENDGVRVLPKQWALYRFKNGESIDYIGITSNLYSRICNHRSKPLYYKHELHKVEYQVAQLGTTWEELCKWERRKIEEHAPGLIKYRGGNGRRPFIEICGQKVEIHENESVEDAVTRTGLFDQISSFMRNLLKIDL